MILSFISIYFLFCQNDNDGGQVGFYPGRKEIIYSNLEMMSLIAMARVVAGRLQLISEQAGGECEALHNDDWLIMDGNWIDDNTGSELIASNHVPTSQAKQDFLTKCSNHASSTLSNDGKEVLSQEMDWLEKGCSKIYDMLLNQQCPTDIPELYRWQHVDLTKLFGLLTYERPDQLTNLHIHCHSATRENVRYKILHFKPFLIYLYILRYPP